MDSQPNRQFQIPKPPKMKRKTQCGANSFSGKTGPKWMWGHSRPSFISLTVSLHTLHCGKWCCLMLGERILYSILKTNQLRIWKHRRLQSFRWGTVDLYYLGLQPPWCRHFHPKLLLIQTGVLSNSLSLVLRVEMAFWFGVAWLCFEQSDICVCSPVSYLCLWNFLVFCII